MADVFVNHSRSEQWLSAPRALLQDVNLSYEASGLLLYLLSKPPSWRVIPSTLVRSGCRRDKVYRILTELQNAQYIQCVRVWDHMHRRIRYEYHIYDEPQMPLTEAQKDVMLPKPLVTEKPCADFPDQENPHSIYKRDQQNTDQTYSSPTIGETVIASDFPATDLVSPTMEHESSSSALTAANFKAQETPKTQKTVKHTSTGEKASKTPRKRDLIYDAVCEAFFKRDLADPTLSGARGQGKLIGIAASKVKQFDPAITADEVREAAKRFFDMYPDIQCIHDGDKIISKIEELRAHRAGIAAKKAADTARQLAGSGGLLLSPQSARAAQSNPRNVKGVEFDD